MKAARGSEGGSELGGDVRRARVVVAGRVQGVWFRGATAERAGKLGISGWVRNLPTGEVEAVFEGPASEVLAAIEWARIGPPTARVDSASVEWELPVGEVGFRVRY